MPESKITGNTEWQDGQKVYRLAVGAYNKYDWPLHASLTLPQEYWPEKGQGGLEYIQVVYASQTMIRIGLPYGQPWESNRYDRLSCGSSNSPGLEEVFGLQSPANGTMIATLS